MKTLYETLEAKLKEKFGKYSYEVDEKVQSAIDEIADILIEELEVRNPRYANEDDEICDCSHCHDGDCPNNDSNDEQKEE